MNIIKLCLIFNILTLASFINAQGANKEFAWGISKEEVLKAIAVEPDNQDEESITYTNQTVVDNNADISYTFYKNQLWRKVVKFTFYDDAKLNELKDLLSSKYGPPSNDSGYASWKKESLSIWIDIQQMELLSIPVSIVKLIYEDEKTAHLYFEEKRKAKEDEL